MLFRSSGRKILSAVFFDRLSGLWALAIITCALVIFMPRLAIPNALTIAVAGIGTVSYYFFLRLLFKQFAKIFVRTHLKALAVQGFQVLAAILILYSLNFDGKFSPYLLIFLVSTIVAIIPLLLIRLYLFPVRPRSPLADDLLPTVVV